MGILDDRNPQENCENYALDAVYSIIAYEYSIFPMKSKNKRGFNI